MPQIYQALCRKNNQSVQVWLRLRILKWGKLYWKDKLRYVGKENVAEVLLLGYGEKKSWICFM